MLLCSICYDAVSVYIEYIELNGMVIERRIWKILKESVRGVLRYYCDIFPEVLWKTKNNLSKDYPVFRPGFESRISRILSLEHYRYIDLFTTFLYRLHHWPFYDSFVFFTCEEQVLKLRMKYSDNWCYVVPSWRGSCNLWTRKQKAVHLLVYWTNSAPSFFVCP
jgi:hypothetical protein